MQKANNVFDTLLSSILTYNYYVFKMADHTEVTRGIHRYPGVRYPVLVPNLQGFHHAVSLQLFF